jgi:hypothetical protein
LAEIRSKRGRYSYAEWARRAGLCRTLANAEHGDGKQDNCRTERLHLDDHSLSLVGGKV